jgi:D-alanyl-D-alanine carboxypeptidase (penicillin-binding protein 5/6)
VRILLVVLAAALALASPSSAAAASPNVSAPAAIVVDARDGHVLYSRAPDDRRAIASATKLMTALVTLERLRPRRIVTAGLYRAAPAESRIDLRPGERMSVGDLLRALLLESANDAAVTLARTASGSVPAFVRAMNRRAAALGLDDTRFSNPIGLDQPGNYSSARDLALLARRLLRNDTLASIVDSPRARLRTGARRRVIDNRNRLVAQVPWIDGVKTGHTLRAGYVLVGSGSRKGARLVSVVLGAPSEAARDADTLALLRHGFRRYRRVRPLRAGTRVVSARVVGHGGRQARLTVRRTVRLTVRRGQRVRVAVEAPVELDGPLEEGERVGTVCVLRDGEAVRALGLVTAEDVPGAGLAGDPASDAGWALVAAVAIGIALAAGRRSRRRRR